MTVNMGNTDRALRIAGAVVLIAAWAAKILTGTLGIVALVIAAMFVVTSVIRWCPAYLPFGISTTGKKPGA